MRTEAVPTPSRPIPNCVEHTERMAFHEPCRVFATTRYSVVLLGPSGEHVWTPHLSGSKFRVRARKLASAAKAVSKSRVHYHRLGLASLQTGQDIHQTEVHVANSG